MSLRLPLAGLPRRPISSQSLADLGRPVLPLRELDRLKSQETQFADDQLRRCEEFVNDGGSGMAGGHGKHVGKSVVLSLF
jgi:hypothetical protein